MQPAVWILGPGLGYTFDVLSIQIILLLYINYLKHVLISTN